MYGSGVGTGRAIILHRKASTLSGFQEAAAVFCVVAIGTTIPASYGYPIATTTLSLATATTALAFPGPAPEPQESPINSGFQSPKSFEDLY